MHILRSSNVIHHLCSQCPILRRCAAEQLLGFVAAHSENSDERSAHFEEISELLVETKWNVARNKEYFATVSHRIGELLGACYGVTIPPE
ncbi:unnamed protein product [Gongylonema pulchrum]|uniref:Gamma-tubulin complex component n=1 Tax=Gongylonema pulchrum TaxID=637853 RepID=A0A183EVE9_9BILA|nr:unnamed protein product [Gongylonema pulchrum]